MVHELGHDLELPDLYDTDESSQGVGTWSVMSYGSWNGVSLPGDSPAHFDPWSKYFEGWISPFLVATTLTNQPIAQAATTPDVYQFLNGTPTTGEYFLVENRQKVGYDGGLVGSGLLIWHIDASKASNRDECYPGGPSCAVSHYKIAVAQADNLYGLEKGGNSWGDAGDPWPGSTGNKNFTGFSSPNSNLYSGTLSNINIANISDSAAIMTATFSMGAAVPALAITDVTINEGNSGTTPFNSTVTMTSNSSQAVTVNYATADGTASAAAGDYVSTFGSLTFNPGEMSKSVPVLVRGDTQNESNETFFVSLSNATNGTISKSQGIGTILNDDVVPLPIVTIAATDNTATEQGATTGTHTVSRTGSTAGALTVNYTVDGTATAGSDYQALAGSVVIAAGQSAAPITIIPIDDAVTGEPNETVIITISNNAAYTVGAPSNSTVIITDNDIIAPDTILDPGPAAEGVATKNTTAVFKFTSTVPSATFKCSLDTAAFTVCTSPKTYTRLRPGSRNFKVQAIAGGVSDPTPASFGWTIDTIAPNTTITFFPALLTNDSEAMFEFISTEAGSGFQCSLDGSLFTPCTSPFISGALADGKHNFQVKALDSVGNVDRSAAKAKAWTVDTTPPITTIMGKPAT